MKTSKTKMGNELHLLFFQRHHEESCPGPFRPPGPSLRPVLPPARPPGAIFVLFVVVVCLVYYYYYFCFSYTMVPAWYHGARPGTMVPGLVHGTGPGTMEPGLVPLVPGLVPWYQAWYHGTKPPFGFTGWLLRVSFHGRVIGTLVE